jgi:hypothetical protein
MPPFDDWLKSLVEDGNRAYARDWLEAQHALPVTDYARLCALVDSVTVPQGRILAPVVHGMGARERSLCLSIRVEPGDRRPRGLMPAALESVERALRDAWADLGGSGEPPAASVRIAVLEAAPDDALPGGIDEESLYLATALAAMLHWGEAHTLANVVATGAEGFEIGHLSTKAALFASVQEELAASQFLALSRSVPAQAHGAHVMTSRSDAYLRVFGFIPWGKGAPATCIHVACEPKKQVIPLFEARQPVVLLLPARIEPVNGEPPHELVEVSRALAALVGPGRRCELTLALPTPAAVYLGSKLANVQLRVRSTTAGAPNDVMWDNSTRTVARKARMQAPHRDEAHLAVLSRAAPEVAPWETLPVGDDVTAGSLAAALTQVMSTYGNTKHLHVRTDLPMPAAFALGAVLANPCGAFTVYDQHGRAWFTG